MSLFEVVAIDEEGKELNRIGIWQARSSFFAAKKGFQMGFPAVRVFKVRRKAQYKVLNKF